MTNSDILRMMAGAIRSCGGENKELYEKQADSMENWAATKEAEEVNKDYCPVGMSNCVVCGWRHPRGVRVSGCPNCHNSFCN